MRAGRLALLILAGSGVSAGQAPPPKVAPRPSLPPFLVDMAPGLWQMQAIGLGPDRRTSRHCLARPDLMLTGGQGQGDAGCSFRTLAATSETATLRFSCDGGLSGRTDIRRDAAGVLTIDAQGVAGRHPFASHAEWRYLGPC